MFGKIDIFSCDTELHYFSFVRKLFTCSSGANYLLLVKGTIIHFGFHHVGITAFLHCHKSHDNK